MSYCVVDDVRGRVPKGVITGSEAVALIQEKIDGASARVDVAMTAGETPLPIPLTAVTALAALLDLVANKAAYDWHASQATVYDPKFTPTWKSWDKAFEDELERMRKGGWRLAVSPTPTAKGNMAWSYTQGSVAGTVSPDPSIDPKIDVNARY